MVEHVPIPAIEPGVIIETARLRLRAHRDNDLDDLVALAGNWQVARWLGRLPHPYSETDGREWIGHVRQKHAAGRPRTFAIALKDSDRLIGGGGIDGHTIGDAEASELGYWLGEPYWGQGYGREAVAAIIDYGFRVLGLEMIQAVTDPGNTASQKVLLACGLTRAAEINLVRPNRGGDAMHMPLFRLSRRGGPSSPIRSPPSPCQLAREAAPKAPKLLGDLMISGISAPKAAGKNRTGVAGRSPACPM